VASAALTAGLARKAPSTSTEAIVAGCEFRGDIAGDAGQTEPQNVHAVAGGAQFLQGAAAAVLAAQDQRLAGHR
jgi:hypothetical protein